MVHKKLSFYHVWFKNGRMEGAEAENIASVIVMYGKKKNKNIIKVEKVD